MNGQRVSGHSVNFRAAIKQLIELPLKGSLAVEAALTETINNAFDARASEVRIMFSSYKGEQALIIMDNGSGFNRNGANSILSYAYSAQDRKDTKTVGANGTGAKAILGLGELEKTKVTIFSFSNEFTNGLELSFDFEYLVALAEKKVKEGNMIEKSSWKKFFQGWERETGSTIILTGFDGRKLNPKTLMSALSSCLTPRTCKMVSFLSNEKLTPITLNKIEGSNFSFQDDSGKLIGNVSLDLYCGGGNDGPKICGNLNYLFDFNSFFKTLSVSQKESVGRIWQSVGGYIYIDNINVYRIHDGSLSKEFYSSGACDELVMILNLVGEELKEMDKKIADEKDIQKQKDFLKRIVAASHKINPVQPHHSGLGRTKATGPQKEEEVYIVPKNITLEKGEEKEITLVNKGTKLIRFKGAKWLTNRLVDITGEGQMVTIKGKEIGKGDLIVSNGDFSHTIKLKVEEPSNTPYIAGPKYINPGSSITYEVRKVQDNVEWYVDSSDEITLIKNTGKSVNIVVNANTELTDFMLRCMDSKNKIIASRRIIISNQRKNESPMVSIGNKYYLLEFGTHYPSCLAQVENDGEDYPIVVINPLHPLIRGTSWFSETKEIISAICSVAINEQVENDGLKTQKANNLLWKSITDYRELIFSQEKETKN